MLINCPECSLQVSDKALFCPHCGYPLKSNSENSTPGKNSTSQKRRSKYKRLPNGFGQITELRNRNLRNRFRAMVTDGKTEYGRPIQKLLKPRAYFPTYQEAYEALLEYNRNPQEPKSDVTVEELHELWKDRVKNSTTSYKAAWSYCKPVYKMRVQDLRPRHIKNCILENPEEIPPSIKPLIKIMFNLMLDYAVEYEIVDRNCSRSFEMSLDNKENAKHHIPFTDDEISKLWSNLDKIKDVDLILIQCYMGWRPQELCLLRIEDVNLDKNYIIGGLKTKAGRSRIVPIHPSVRPLIESRLAIANQTASEWLFTIKSKPITYPQYRKLMIVLIKGYIMPDKPGDPWIPCEKWEEYDDDKVNRFSCICKICKETNYPNCIDRCKKINFKPGPDVKIPGYNC